MSKTQVNETASNSKRNRANKSNKKEPLLEPNVDNIIKQEATEYSSLLLIPSLDKKQLTKIDLIDDVCVYAFYDIHTLHDYVKLNNLISYKNPDAVSASVASKSSKSRRSDSKQSKRREEPNENDDLYDCSYLKKLDDNLANEDFSQSEELSDQFEDSFNEDTKSTVWQTTLEKQKRHNLEHHKQRNVSLTSSSLRSYSSRTDSSSTGSLSPAHSLPECGKAHCKLGCICDALSASLLLQENSSCSPTPCKQQKTSYFNNNNSSNCNNKNDESENSNHYRDHCGRFECMFECNCSRRLRSSTRRITARKEFDQEVANSKSRKETKINNNRKSIKNEKNLNSKLKLNSKAAKLKQMETKKTTQQQLRQSKRVKLLKKKKSLSKDAAVSKNTTPSSFKDFYFYYHCDNKLSSLKSRKKTKQETELDVNFDEEEEEEHQNADEDENYADVDEEEEHKDDSDFVLSNNKSKKNYTIKKKTAKKTESSNTTTSVKATFQPYTQNITLKIQSKTQYSASYVSIPLRIEVFTSKWDTMSNLNKRVLRLLAKLFQKVDLANESKKTFRELEFEFDKEVDCVVFAASHLKDCSNEDQIKPVGVKISDHDSKELMSKSRLKALINEDEHKLFSLVYKNEDKSSVTTNTPKKVNNENKICVQNRALPRLIISRKRATQQHKQLTSVKQPTQTSLIFRNVETLLAKVKSQMRVSDLSKLSPKLTQMRPKHIHDAKSLVEPNDCNYVFRDEIAYAEKRGSSEYAFYNPFVDESLVLDLYRECESRQLVDAVCETVNDMIRVVSLYSENLTEKKSKEIENSTSNAVNTVKLARITTSNNKTNFIIINQKAKQEEEPKKTDNSELSVQRKIILPSTSMNFKTLVKIVSSNKEDETNKANNQIIKISSSLVPTSKPSLPTIIKAKPAQPTITKIITPIASVSKGLSHAPRIITMPFRADNIVKTTASMAQPPKIVSITQTTAGSSNSKSFIPIRPKLAAPLTGLIMSDSTNVAAEEDSSSEYIESRKRKRKQDLSNLSTHSVRTTSIVTLKPIPTIDNHLNILNKQINSIKNESGESPPLKKITTISSPFKVSSSLFKHTLTPVVVAHRAVSIESTADLNESIRSDSSEPSASKRSKILVAKENDSEEEILDSDNSDSENECKKSTSNSTIDSSTTTSKKRKTSNSRNQDDSSDCSFDDDDDEYEDEFEKKMTKKLLSASVANTNSSKPIVNNIHSIRERQRRFRLKKLLIKLKIVLYECESNCKYDLENSEAKLKLDEYFNKKNFKMKSKQNILQEAVLLIRDLQIQEKKLQTLIGMELKRNQELKFHLKELI